MKPDWKDAPPWAQWLTYDADGWYWWEREPRGAGDSWWPTDASEYCPANPRGTASKEQRPTTGEGAGMDRDELIAFLRENLRITVETDSVYNGGMGDGPMHDETKTIQLWLDGEIISGYSL